MRRLITLTIAAACSAGLSAAINSPGAEGFFSRGLAMYDDHNYVGCIDQLVQLRSFTLTPRQSEDAMYYLAMATLHSDDDEALELLDEFMNRYPSSPRYQDALASTGDFYFTRGDYKAALERYGRVNPEALTPGRHADLRYRTGYSQLMLGNYEQAAPCFEELRSDAEYGNAARFYLAYMAYEQKDYDRALELFGEVDATREPGLAAPYYQSQIYFMRGDYAKALDMALKVIDANVVPQFAPEANRIAGESYYNMGHLDSALPYLWRYAAQAENPQPSTLYILGVSEYESGNYETSIPLFQKATRAEGRAGRIRRDFNARRPGCMALLRSGICQERQRRRRPDGLRESLYRRCRPGSDRNILLQLYRGSQPWRTHAVCAHGADARGFSQALPALALCRHSAGKPHKRIYERRRL